MDQPIAERSLYGMIDGANVAVVVRLWAPQRVDGHSECRFVFQSVHLAQLKDGAGHGIDDMQALIEALHGIGAALDKSGVEWSMFSDEELRDEGAIQIREDGFPRAGLSVMFLGSAFRKRIESYVEGEKLGAIKSLPRPKRPPTLRPA